VELFLFLFLDDRNGLDLEAFVEFADLEDCEDFDDLDFVDFVAFEHRLEGFALSTAMRSSSGI